MDTAAFLLVNGDFTCPPDHRLMSPSFASQHPDTVCYALPDWAVARLAGNQSMSGPAMNCEISEQDHRELELSLCLPLRDYSLIRGVLLQGGFRSQAELNAMSQDDWREVLIIELANRTAESGKAYRQLDNATLAGVGALYNHLSQVMLMKSAALAQLDLDLMRQTVRYQIRAQTGLSMTRLLPLTDLELIEILLKG